MDKNYGVAFCLFCTLLFGIAFSVVILSTGNLWYWQAPELSPMPTATPQPTATPTPTPQPTAQITFLLYNMTGTYILLHSSSANIELFSPQNASIVFNTSNSYPTERPTLLDVSTQATFRLIVDYGVYGGATYALTFDGNSLSIEPKNPRVDEGPLGGGGGGGF